MKVMVLSKDRYIHHLFPEFPIVESREEALMAFVGKKWDVVIATIDMLWVIEELKKKGRKFWTIFISYNCAPTYYKKALEVGDFCYLYSTPEMVRIRLEWLRRFIFRQNGELFRYGELVYNFKLGKLFTPEGEEIPLTRGEKDVLEVLIKNRDRFISNREILENSDISSEESIKVLVSRLRKKGFKIVNRSRIGYRLVEKNGENGKGKGKGKGKNSEKSKVNSEKKESK